MHIATASRSTWRLTALAPIAAIVVSACGGGEGDKSPGQILQDSAGAVKSAQSFHVSGTGSSSSGSASFDIKVAGPNTVGGSLTFGGATANFVVVNGNTYFQGQQFFSQFAGADAANLVGDNWVLIPASQASSATAGLSTFTDTSKLSGCISSLSSHSYTKSTSSVNGQSVVVLSSSMGYTIDIAANGTAYPVQIAGSGTANLGSACGNTGSTSGNSGSGTIKFDSWGQSTSVTPPPNPIDLSGIAGGGSSAGTTPTAEATESPSPT